MPQEYEPIEPESAYDRKGFLDGLELLLKLEKDVSVLRQDPNNPDAIMKVGKRIHGDPSFYTKSPNSAGDARVGADRVLSQGLEAIARNVEHNLDTFLGILDDESMLNVVASVPLQKTGNAEHDKFVDAVTKYREVQIASRDPRAKVAYVQSKLQNVQDWLKEEVGLIGRPEYMDRLFNSYEAEARANFGAVTHTDKGNIRSAFIKSRIRTSIDKSKRMLDEADDEDKQDVWDDVIKPHYEVIARIAYPIEKEKED